MTAIDASVSDTVLGATASGPGADFALVAAIACAGRHIPLIWVSSWRSPILFPSVGNLLRPVPERTVSQAGPPESHEGVIEIEFFDGAEEQGISGRC